MPEIIRICRLIWRASPVLTSAEIRLSSIKKGHSMTIVIVMLTITMYNVIMTADYGILVSTEDVFTKEPKP
jgi:hypothetical protein